MAKVQFKSKVLLKAQKEIPQKTDIDFTFQEIKQGRKVVEITFYIKTKVINTPKSEPEHFIRHPQLYQCLQEYFLLSKEQAQKVLEQHTDEYIQQNLAVVEERYKQNKIDKSKLGAYTLKALEEDFRPKRSAFDQEQQEKEQAQRAQAAKAEKEKRFIEQLRKDFEANKLAKVGQVLAKINHLKYTEEKKKIIEKFKKTKINGILVDYYQREGLNSSIIKALFDNFLAENYLDKSDRDFITYAESQGHQVVKKNNEFMLAKEKE